MARKQGAVTVARMRCPTPGCGQAAAVFQNVRDYLYTRCGGCGADQRNGQAAQIYFWQHAEPLDGAVIQRPPNVPESAGAIGCAVTGEAPPVVVIEPEPEPAPAPGQAPEPKGVEPKPAAGGVVWLVLGLVGVGVATLASAATLGNQ